MRLLQLRQQLRVWRMQQLQQLCGMSIHAHTVASALSPATSLTSSERLLIAGAEGLLSRLDVAAADGDEPFFVCTAHIGNWAGPTSKRSPRVTLPPMHGNGVGLSVKDALIPAIAESIERYSTACFHEQQFTWASANQIKRRVLNLDCIAMCSEIERKNPHCALGLPNKAEPIRWVEGIDLHDGLAILVPAVMTHAYTGWRGPQERFWLPISTGCAAHVTYEEAIFSGLSEVIERDAISLVWLQQLSLPEIVIDEPGPELATPWSHCLGGSADVVYRFFNATTDIGLPTVYGVQVSRHHPYAHTLVACSAAPTYDRAIAKVIKDFAMLKRGFSSERSTPNDPAHFTGVLDGARFMATCERAVAFSFLLDNPRHVALSFLREQQPEPVSLHDVLDRLCILDMHPVAVDLTTDEAIRLGLCVVRVLVPELQPLSLRPSSQYLAHPRLYTAPLRMGYLSRPEEQLNPSPQPFA